jgi:hypothetical protein
VRPSTIAPQALAHRLDEIEAAGADLRAMVLVERIAAFDRLAARWLQPGFAPRRRALATLPAITGYAPETIRHAIDRLWAALSARELGRVAAGELGSGGVPERLAFHSLAGNVPGVGLLGIVAALVAGVPSLVKTAEREPLLPLLFAESLAGVEPRLAAALAVAHWPGGSRVHQRLAVSRASVVLAYGRDDSIASLAAHAPPRLLRFGPHLSVAVVCRESAGPDVAAVAARQVALFDQQGCLSPQYLVLEEGEPETTDAFLAALIESFRRLAVELPQAPLTLGEATAAWRHLEHQRWREQEGEPVRVLADRTARFSVVCDRGETLPPSPLNRHLVVLSVADLGRARARLEQLAGTIETIGVAAPASRRGELAALADTCGAHRLCPLERMQAPPFAWRQSGHARLASLLVPGSAPAAEPPSRDATPNPARRVELARRAPASGARPTPTP